MRYFFADCVLDMQCYLLRRAGAPIRLRPKVFQMLTYLLEHRHRVVPKQELCEQVWAAQAVSDATIENCLKAIRQAIGDTGQAQRLIETRYGQGYRFVAPVLLGPEGSSPVASAALVSAPPNTSCAPASLPPSPASRGLLGGASLREDACPVGEWKVVTALSCALVLPPASSEPWWQEIRQRQRHTLQEVAHDEAQRYGGLYRALGGDGVLLVFGAPVAQEDHAARAIYAALDLQRQLVSGKSGATETCEARLGLHTGDVAVETRQALPEANAVVVGETVTQAVALQEQALPGAILCSATTAHLVQRFVRLQAMSRMTVEGQATLGTVYKVLERRTRRLAAVPSTVRVQVPFVGRTREFAMLHDVWQHVAQGQGHIVSVIGEAGMGKSRLVTAFRRSLRGQDHAYVQGACVSYGQTLAYEPVQALIRHACGITTGDPPGVMAAKIHRRLYEVGMDPTTTAASILRLCASATTPTPTECEPQTPHPSTFTVLLQWSLQSSQRCPLVIEVEDLQWIDAASEAWLAKFASRVADMRILLLVTYRPGYQPTWMGHSAATQVALSRLTTHDSAQLVRALLPAPGASTERLDEIVRQGAGNPLFLGALARRMAMQGTLQGTRGLADPLYATLTARIDHLSPVAKCVLQTAAILGKEVPYTLLEAAAALPASVLAEGLSQLQSAEILSEIGLAPEPVYAFKYGLLRDTAYQALLDHSRRQQHARIAQALAAQLATATPPPLARIAHHYTEAGCTEQAIAYWQEAGQQAAQQAAHAEAIAAFTQALTLLDTLTATPARARQELVLQCHLGMQLATRGAATQEVERTYARALALCQQVGNTQELFPVLYGLSRLHKKRGKLRRARDLGEQLLLLAQRHNDAALHVRAHYVLGDILLWQGEFPAARTHLEQGLQACDPSQHASANLLHDTDPWLGCLGALAVTLWFLGYPDQARQRIAEALALAYALAQPYLVARTLAKATYLAWFLRDWSALRSHAEELRTLAASHGFAELYARATYRHGLALVQQGQLATGLEQFHESLQVLQRLQSGDAQALRLTQLAELYRAVGQPEAGLRTMAAALAADTEAHFDASERLSIQGKLLLMLPHPDVQQAEHCFQHALTVARRQQAKMPELRAALALSRLWQRQGKHAAAYGLLAPVYEWFTEGLTTTDLQEAHGVLEDVRCDGPTVLQP